MLSKIRDWLIRVKRRIVATILSLLAALGLYTATADTVTDTISWTNPTTRVDGTPLTNLASSRVQWGPTPGGPYDGGSVDVPAPGSTATVTRSGLGFGTRCYVVISIDANGLQSVPSEEACKTVTAVPASATNVTIH
jgi:hypothetical protein